MLLRKAAIGGAVTKGRSATLAGRSAMTSNVWYVAAIWMGLAFLASLVSIKIGISVALIEILIGILAGNYLGIHQTTEWINFLAMLGSGVLTFLAGAEIDPVSLKGHLKASLGIGVLSFLAPFLVVWAFAQFVLGWGTASGADRGHRAVHHLGGRGLCRDDRREVQRNRDGKDDPRRLLHHGLRNGPGPGHPFSRTSTSGSSSSLPSSASCSGSCPPGRGCW